MIKAVFFDLDGTLIQTEVLKATSYAKAIGVLTKGAVSEEEVIGGFEDLVGLSRQEVVQGLYAKFSTQLHRKLSTDNSDGIQKKLIEKRLELYHELLNDKALLSNHFCPFNLKLLDTLYQNGLYVAVATMSHRKEVLRVIEFMEIGKKLNFVLTRDDVKQGKPNPEIYVLAKKQLNVASDECLVIEDSTNGIKAGLAAGMHVIAVTNDITRKSVHSAGVLNARHIVDDLNLLENRVQELMERER